MNIFPFSESTSESPTTGIELTLGLVLGISAAAILLAILVAIVFIFVRSKRHKQKSNLAEIAALGPGNRTIECRPSLAYILMGDGCILPNMSDRGNSLTYNQAYSEIDDEYYYTGQYWAPAEKRSDLLDQLKMLKIRTVMEKDIDEKVLLGRGAFGLVYKGVWHSAVAGSEEITEEEVAVKTMEDADEEDSVKFLQEATIMGQFSHVNIVKILAIVIADDMCKIVMEFMSKGDLKKHLKTMISGFPDTMELSSQLLYYSRQVASGVSYLSSKGYVHRDLATRNVLVSGDDICKIGDFGLSRELQNVDQTYLAEKGGKIPVKWTAPEALNYGRYSTASDIWSFGCVLYEIWSLGVAPFSKFNINDAFLKITSNYQLPPPPGCPRSIYEVMIKCWHSEADSRPNAEDICSQLNRPEFRVLKWSSEDKTNYSEMARTVGMPLEVGEALFKDLQQSS